MTTSDRNSVRIIVLDFPTAGLDSFLIGWWGASFLPALNKFGPPPVKSLLDEHDIKFVIAKQGKGPRSEVITYAKLSTSSGYKKKITDGFGQTDMKYLPDENSSQLVAGLKAQGTKLVLECMGKDSYAFNYYLPREAARNFENRATLEGFGFGAKLLLKG